MQYGICPLSLISVRVAADVNSEMVTQILYGEHFKVLENRKHFSRIRKAYDAFEGWVQNDQFIFINKEVFHNLETSPKKYSTDLVSFVESKKGTLIAILMGSSLGGIKNLQHTFDGKIVEEKKPKTSLIPTALYYMEAPFLSGGLTPFGVDSSGFTQMVYRINGYQLLRTSALQATQGNALSFIEESEAGDLAFFDSADGEINHVGIIMQDNYIIHVNGKVRIDRIDHTGIFNPDEGIYTHKLRVIKQVI